MKPHETLPNHLFLPGISRAEPHQQRAPSFFRPSPPPDPLTPQRPPTFCPSTMRRAKKQFPSRKANEITEIASGLGSVTPTYDPVGNMTAAPINPDLSTGQYTLNWEPGTA